jgi:hypothetical protein
MEETESPRRPYFAIGSAALASFCSASLRLPQFVLDDDSAGSAAPDPEPEEAREYSMLPQFLPDDDSAGLAAPDPEPEEEGENSRPGTPHELERVLDEVADDARPEVYWTYQYEGAEEEVMQAALRATGRGPRGCGRGRRVLCVLRVPFRGGLGRRMGTRRAPAAVAYPTAQHLPRRVREVREVCETAHSSRSRHPPTPKAFSAASSELAPHIAVQSADAGSAALGRRRAGGRTGP